jgi:hypothetical protein
MEENIEYKQQFLRSEIIDQGYNPDDFSEYMANVRGDDNLNLETWSFSDLQTVVENFLTEALMKSVFLPCHSNDKNNGKTTYKPRPPSTEGEERETGIPIHATTRSEGRFLRAVEQM